MFLLFTTIAKIMADIVFFVATYEVADLGFTFGALWAFIIMVRFVTNSFTGLGAGFSANLGAGFGVTVKSTYLSAVSIAAATKTAYGIASRGIGRLDTPLLHVPTRDIFNRGSHYATGAVDFGGTDAAPWVPFGQKKIGFGGRYGEDEYT